MSLSMHLYLADIEQVGAAVGSRDEKLRRMIGGRFKRNLTADDDYFRSEIERGAPTRYESLRAVIDGGPFDPAWAFQYAYAYELICRFHGRFLDNNWFSPFRFAWLGQVDEQLQRIGLTAVTVSAFSYPGFPPPLPTPSDLPGCGEWRPDECRKALDQWEAVTPEQRAELPRDERAAIESCVEWMRAATAREGHGIIGFCY
ncbi:DUF7691 family protein [Allonocardiopsis opalescens]|nr:hypothetical protein [Allonocardiopsis opalescens]